MTIILVRKFYKWHCLHTVIIFITWSCISVLPIPASHITSLVLLKRPWMCHCTSTKSKFCALFLWYCRYALPSLFFKYWLLDLDSKFWANHIVNHSCLAYNVHKQPRIRTAIFYFLTKIFLTLMCMFFYVCCDHPSFRNYLPPLIYGQCICSLTNVTENCCEVLWIFFKWITL